LDSFGNNLVLATEKLEVSDQTKRLATKLIDSQILKTDVPNLLGAQSPDNQVQ
jgi:hypothetical protein